MNRNYYGQTVLDGLKPNLTFSTISNVETLIYQWEALGKALPFHNRLKGKTMTQEQLQLINQLRETGHAVIVWTPRELKGLNPDQIEYMSFSYGFELIDMNETERMEECD